MIDINLIISLVIFYFVMYVTPGPNNAIVLSSGLQFGFIKTIPVMAGITAGHVLQLVLVCLGLGKVFNSFPQVQTLLKILCSIYILYLAYRIIGSISKVEEKRLSP
jgi:Putative threonine efflux protein